MRYCEQYKTFGAFVKTTTRRVCRPVLELSTLTRKGGYLVIVTIYRVFFSLLFLLPKALRKEGDGVASRVGCILFCFSSLV